MEARAADILQAIGLRVRAHWPPYRLGQMRSDLAAVSPSPSTGVLMRVDAHAHYHRCYNIGPFVQAAHRNLCADPSRTGETSPLGCLMLAGLGGSNPILRILAEQDQLPDGWTIRQTNELSVVLQRDGVDRIVLITGRQVRTAERLELLTFGARAPVVDGKPFGIALGHAVECSKLVIVPWALGKWRLGRESKVRDALQAVRGRGAPVFLGDNANRYRRMTPTALSRLSSLARGVLPGTDPIAHPSEVRRVGGFGFEIEHALDRMAPARSLLSALRDGAAVTPFGSARSLAGVVAGQIRVRVAAGSI